MCVLSHLSSPAHTQLKGACKCCINTVLVSSLDGDGSRVHHSRPQLHQKAKQTVPRLILLPGESRRQKPSVKVNNFLCLKQCCDKRSEDDGEKPSTNLQHQQCIWKQKNNVVVSRTRRCIWEFFSRNCRCCLLISIDRSVGVVSVEYLGFCRCTCCETYWNWCSSLVVCQMVKNMNVLWFVSLNLPDPLTPPLLWGPVLSCLSRPFVVLLPATQSQTFWDNTAYFSRLRAR